MAALHWRLIINGKSAGHEPLRAAVAAMRARGVRVSPRVTWEHGDAARYVAEALDEGVDTLVAAGGDGTFGEVAAALAQREADASALPGLGLVPLGTANDFAVAARLPQPAEEALALIADAPARAIDLLRFRGDDDGPHWCANLASGGLGPQVTAGTDEGLKRMLGGLAYLITAIARLGRIEPLPARIRGPGFGWSGAFIALGVGNGRQAGGGRVLCPDAVVDDGLLELTVVPELSGELGKAVGALLTEGGEAALERVATRARLPWLELESTQPLTLHLDGEPLTSRHFHVDCVPRRLRMHLPPGCPLLGGRGDPGGPGGPPAEPSAIVPA